MTKHQKFYLLRHLSLFLALLLAMFTIAGCEGDRGANGSSTGAITGQVIDNGGNKLAGVTVTPSPAVTTPTGALSTTTDTNGNYTLIVPGGSYTLTFSKQGYQTVTQSADVVITQTTTVNATMTQTAAAVVNVANANFSNGTATLTANILVNDRTLQGQPATFTWTDAAGNPITAVSSGTTSTVTVNQPTTATLKGNVAQLTQVRMGLEPVPSSDEEADENDIDVPSFQTLNRFRVVGVTQQAFQGAAVNTYTVTATVNGQTFTANPTVSVSSNTLPFVPNPGIRNVPIGQPVLLQGVANAGNNWNWTLTTPTGSTATLTDATTRYPSFLPDVSGTYTVTETVSGLSMNIYAGTYQGAVVAGSTGSAKGLAAFVRRALQASSSSARVNVDPACTNTGAGCHASTAFFSAPYNGGVQFFSTTPINTVFDEWAMSGHAAALINGLQGGSSYSIANSAMFQTVGFSQFSSPTAVHNGGFSDVAGPAGFTTAAAQATAPDFFANFPAVQRVSGVQCESCHGPNGVVHPSGGDVDKISSRFSIASDVCGTCHFSRFQEWRGSGHGDFETAIDEGMQGGPRVSTICGACHTGQGFPIYVTQLESGNPTRVLVRNATYSNLSAAVTPNNVQPQVCAACHRVHNVGTHDGTGLTGFAVVLRGDFQPGGAWDGTTPLLPAGFQATGVGKGALCIVCHNSRNGQIGSTLTVGLHEDGDLTFGPLTSYTFGGGTPHEACQGDVLMGHNAYFFSGPEDRTLTGFPKVPQTGRRSAHSFIADTCVTCHMELAKAAGASATSDYPFGIQGGGSNHTFAIANDPTKPESEQVNAICANCHGSFQGTGVQNSFDTAYNAMLKAIANAILRLKFGSTGAIPAGTTLTFIPGRTPAVYVSGAATSVSLSSYLASAPGTANTPALPASGFLLDLAKANWNTALVAPGYTATSGGTSYDNGTPIPSGTGLTSDVSGDQSKAIHNPSFVFNVMSVTTQRMNAL